MRLLLARGADPKVVTEKGETALLLLAGAGWPLGQGYIRSEEEITAALDLLVEEFGMDVNAATTEGITPVIGAIFKGDNFVVQYLVDHGARLDVKDAQGPRRHHVGAGHRGQRGPAAAAAARDREARARAHGEAGHHDRDGELARQRAIAAQQKRPSLASDGLLLFASRATRTLLLQVELDVDGDVLRHPARVVPAFADVEVEAVDGHRAGELAPPRPSPSA